MPKQKHISSGHNEAKAFLNLDVLFFAHPAASKIRAKFANESMANSLWPQPSWVDNESAT